MSELAEVALAVAAAIVTNTGGKAGVYGVLHHKTELAATHPYSAVLTGPHSFHGLYCMRLKK